MEYAYASVADAPVRAIWTAGSCPLDAEGRTVAVGSHADQTHQVMRNLVTALAGVGASLSDVVKTTVHGASSRQGDLVEAWEVYREYMGAHDAPSEHPARRDRARVRRPARRGGGGCRGHRCARHPGGARGRTGAVAPHPGPAPSRQWKGPSGGAAGRCGAAPEARGRTVTGSRRGRPARSLSGGGHHRAGGG
ncbi:hypothetical protein GCM10010446_33050 [Streptomyces enissocaesilis]|uniref:RidA family protein n=1 Tax=Streptomyces enissocaesilis TaxID=332589 RepID=A0ABP6JSJ6_9ACTN